ncbi:MAG: hypothetical protein ACR2KS_10295 [Candidatus Eremiobacter antarcticus]|nr:phage replisome organizer N-terminal domain-containing protein [Candidatus Eremiobacteraeota bacterium]MBC5808823.1 phage replisome organizer N-terminal domain-containing protein [Candidatus Eremiobacteraeota bacterium]
MRIWVKLWTDIIFDLDFVNLSPDARCTFFYCLALAGRCDSGGALRSRASVITAAHLAKHTSLAPERQEQVLQELIDTGFMKRSDEVYSLSNWDKYQAPVDEHSAKRSKAYRERHGSVTLASRSASRPRHGVRHGNVTSDTDTDTDTDTEPDTEPERRRRPRVRARGAPL